MSRDIPTKVFAVGVALYALLGLAASSLVSATTFYVDPVNGSMTNNGSSEAPWRTAQEVFESGLICTRDLSGKVKNPDGPVKAGDTILLRTGYHGEIYCRGAYNDDWITIAAEKGNTPKIRRIFFSTAKKWIIRGLTVSPSFGSEYKPDRMIYIVDWGGGSSDFVIEDNRLFSSPDARWWSAEQWDKLACHGISVIADKVVIGNNDLKYVNYGILVSGDTAKVESNRIEHISGDGIVCSADNTALVGNSMKYFYKVNDNHDDAIQFHRGSDKLTPIRSAIVRGNIIIAWDGAVKNPLLGSPQGICNFDSPALNWRIENNIVLVQHHHGITVGGCQDGVIVNNIAYNPYGGDFLAGIALGTTHGETPSVRTVIKNNLVDSKVSCPPNNTVNHNIVVENPDAYFVDIKHFDVRPRATSPSIDAGADDVAPETDIVGTKRPQGKGVDIGPYEFMPAVEVAK